MAPSRLSGKVCLWRPEGGAGGETSISPCISLNYWPKIGPDATIERNILTKRELMKPKSDLIRLNFSFLFEKKSENPYFSITTNLSSNF